MINPIPLQEYIDVNYRGVKSSFAKDYGLQRQNVNSLLKAGYVVIGETLYRPMAFRK